MARKPSRFWHPARRLLLRAQEQTRAFVARDHAAAKLDDVRPRLQHYLRAMYGESVAIESLASTPKSGWATRALLKLALAKKRSTSESDGNSMRLPASLPLHNTGVSPLEQYRVIAVQHAERLRRGSARHARDVTSDLERDLYLLAESAAVDAQILAEQPGLRTALDAARAESMAQRPRPRFRTEIELCVEEMIRRAWPNHVAPAEHAERAVIGTQNSAPITRSDSPKADLPTADLPTVPQDNTAELNATWARRTAVALESRFGRKAARSYRRVPDITVWQTSVTSKLSDDQALALETETRQGSSNAPPDEWDSSSRSLIPGAARSQVAPDEAGHTAGKTENETTSDKPKADGADGAGDERNSGKNGSDGAQPEATKNERTSATGASHDVNAPSDGPTPAGAGDPERDKAGLGHSDATVDDSALIEGVTFRYPEWDFNAHNFNAAGTVVRVIPAPIGSDEWATNALLAHARETLRAKRQFERLRSHRLRLRRQVQGDELDIDACVEAMIDRQMGRAPSDRLYSHVRPGRRELAITLLIDISGSTGDDVEGQQRVIDIERIAALVATAAFDALGDDYSILAFSSAGPANVRVHTLKEFGEKNSTVVLQRISALAPHGTTRLGAAVRHATATLSEHPAPHRLLLILSDGKPSDYDWYFTDYAIQDSRHAVMNARLQGIHPFCITVDTTDGETYLTEIFGSAGYRVVSSPSQLSQALLLVVQRMLVGSG